MRESQLTFLEFFAGGGMARAGLGESWRCLFANDFDAMKVATYVRNYGDADIKLEDVGKLTIDDLPSKSSDLAWASFPCQDLSLAGEYRGLGRERDRALTRSGTFWPFWKLMRGLAEAGRSPRAIVLENVYGCLTSHGGKDFAAIGSALSGSEYRFGAIVINASHFVPQSRPRVFFIAIDRNEALHTELVSNGPDPEWHPQSLVDAYAGLSPSAKKRWLWWEAPAPPARNTRFADLIEEEPTGVDWHSPAETGYLLSLMSPVNQAKVASAKLSGKRTVGSVYRRMRPDTNGVKRQRAEVRFDDLAGCLRTPAGGSSRQSILVIDGERVRSRLLSAREAARLMALGDRYRLPERYNDAYHVCGDGVCVPVVQHIAKTILEPILAANPMMALAAAE
ncbi:MAG TPA: DNA cytosine methyltransferase [Roseiarcus sp.]|jgi:DNA (cytosine-5)-methyltransferase 1